MKETHLDPGLDEEQQVCYFLESHPDFFERHSELLEKLVVPHATAGATSLIERQVSVLREKSNRLENQLEDLLRAARDNEQLASHLQKLSVELLYTHSVDEVMSAVQSVLTNDFGIEFVATRIIAAEPEKGCSMSPGSYLYENSPAFNEFSSLLQERKAVCGKPRLQQLEVLFPHQVEHIRSAAILPLVGGKALGVLALGSVNPRRFQASQGTLFLDYLSRLISAGLAARM